MGALLTDFNWKIELDNLKHGHIGYIRLTGIQNFVIMLAVLLYVMFQSKYSR